MKKQLLDRATAIHAVKFNKSSIYQAAANSSELLMDMMNSIENAEDENEQALKQVRKEIDIWAATSPIVTERDILGLRPKLRNN